MLKEAKARILINDLLRRSGWRFLTTRPAPQTLSLKQTSNSRRRVLEDLGDDFEKTATGFVDYSLLDERGLPDSRSGSQVGEA